MPVWRLAAWSVVEQQPQLPTGPETAAATAPTPDAQQVDSSADSMAPEAGPGDADASVADVVVADVVVTPDAPLDAPSDAPTPAQLALQFASDVATAVCGRFAACCAVDDEVRTSTPASA